MKYAPKYIYPEYATELTRWLGYLLVFFGGSGRRQLSLVDELLRQFTQSLTDTQTSTPFITAACTAVPRKDTQELLADLHLFSTQLSSQTAAAIEGCQAQPLLY